MIRLSSKFGVKEYVHNKEIIQFRRIYGGIGWPSGLPGCAIVIGEENFNDQTNYFLLAEIHEKTITGLIKSIQDLHKRYRIKIPVSEWFGRQTTTIDHVLTQQHTKSFNERKPQLFVSDAPGDGDSITYHVETVLNCLDPKVLYLFNESQVPAAMQGFIASGNKGSVESTAGLKNDLNPIVTALGYALTALVDFPFYSAGDIVLPASIY